MIPDKYTIMFLNKLLSKDCWGGKHTDEEHLLHLIKHLPRTEFRSAKKSYEQLIKKGRITS